jgi:hypothetical protein
MPKEVAEVSTETSVESKPMYSWSQSERDSSKQKYGCEIMVENGTWEQVSTKECPNDARIVTYEVDGEVRYDLTRSAKAVNIFDMYWDKFREGIKNIEYGNGRVSPKLWGYQAPKTKKKK